MSPHTPQPITASELIASLSPLQIRERLAAIAAERKALMTLLRAAIRAERGRVVSPAQGIRDAK